MNVTKTILQSLIGKTITNIKTNEDNLVVEFKSGEKITLHVNLSKGVGYDSFKEKTNVKLDRVTRQGEKALGVVEKDQAPKKRIHKKKQETA